jgi:hypothetical protein
MAKKRYVNGFATLHSLVKQVCTPKNDFNMQLEANKVENALYHTACKNHNGRSFFTQKKMHGFRRLEMIIYGRRKRGIESIDIHPWDAAYVD